MAHKLNTAHISFGRDDPGGDLFCHRGTGDSLLPVACALR